MIHYQPLGKSFLGQTTPETAKTLLGKILVHDTREGTAAGRIVETEAYLYYDDAACHAARGRTARNTPMFGPPGTAYIYLIYGVHYCFNVVTAEEGVGEAVLVRALEPLAGLEIMARRRGVDDTRKLASGPGKLCKALGIGPERNGLDLTSGPPLYLADDGYDAGEILTSTRIGISVAADLPLRFYLAGNLYVSRK